MSEEDAIYCEPRCPCILTRKRIVLTILALCCMALVTWTVVVTAKTPNQLGGSGINTTYVFIDDSKGIENLNITMNSVLKMKKHSSALNKAIKKVEEKHPLPDSPATRLQIIKRENEDLCKCICTIASNKQDIMNALRNQNDMKEF
ncbi:unnamed protein product [Lepeophtheirus salmonis]|uniref:(salmon louse) hypothetical protein n=1 Tax=Lepeophtheirus salmonis TaxID=72036 RepID=A0A7R8D3W7_LEPSM|nr:unnamed protein product [Lepeophtheirus salmonis]CAF3015858.1 unnamed protein product [Lepeophtheirus salmonis]